MWTDQYVGIPFKINGIDRNGLDCWHLIALVYKEKLGIELPLFNGLIEDHSITSLRRIVKTINEWKTRWIKVDKPQQFDVVLLRMNNLPCHIGIVVSKNKMLHVMKDIQSVVEDYTNFQWIHKIEGFYKYYGK